MVLKCVLEFSSYPVPIKELIFRGINVGQFDLNRVKNKNKQRFNIFVYYLSWKLYNMMRSMCNTVVYKHHNNTIRLTIQNKAALTTCVYR